MAFISVATGFLPGPLLILGALTILSGGLYLCSRILRKPVAIKRPQVNGMQVAQEVFFDITSRLNDVLKSSWLLDARPTGPKGRLRSALRSWHEDMVSDIPAFSSQLMKNGFPFFLRDAEDVLQCIETMEVKNVQEDDLLEAAEHQVFDILERLSEFVDA
ncbi:MAG: hypothetical protein PVF65_08760 [Sphingomonadales bacterium]